MNSRELALCAISHQRPPRLPFTLYLASPLQKKIEQIMGPREQWPVPQDDLIRILWDVEVEIVSPTLFKDLFGCEWQREEGGYVFINPPLKEPDVSLIPRIDLLRPYDIARIQDARTRRPDAFIFYQFTATLGERLWCLRGLERTLMDYLTEPAFVHEALDILLEMHMKALDVILPLPIDGVTFGDDFGTQRGLMISRKIFCEFFRPRLTKLYDRVRMAGKVVGHHSCGDNTGLMADFVDIGLQVFHPLQSEAMDIRAIKREFGKSLTFRGGIGTQGPIVFGTPDDARRAVRESVRILSEGGGYLFETSKPLPEETPVENAIAVIEEFARSMRYEF